MTGTYIPLHEGIWESLKTFSMCVVSSRDNKNNPKVREESSRLHTGGGTVRWVCGSMAEKGRGHEMKLLMVSTGTALPS